MHFRRHQYQDSSEQEDNDYVAPLKKVERSIPACRSIDDFIKNKTWNLGEQNISQNQVEEQVEIQALKPKMLKQTKQPIIPNSSKLTSQPTPSKNKRPLTAAYTFKLKPAPLSSKKKNDPVALFQRTSQSWKRDKFLKSQANNKEGRKLELQHRNKKVNKI